MLKSELVLGQIIRDIAMGEESLIFKEITDDNNLNQVEVQVK